MQRFHDKVYTAICSEKTLQSNEKGFFMQFAESVVNHAGQEWVQKTFGNLKSDQERFRIIYENEAVKAVVCETLSHVQEIYRKKSAEVSQARRYAADQAFRKKEFQKALALYSQSVLRAPQKGEDPSLDSGASLALALWGRSSVLMAIQEYNLALLDIQVALKENLEESYKAEAFWRMGICYKATGEENRAKVSFTVAEKLLQNDEDKSSALKKDMQKTYVQISHILEKEIPKVTCDSDEHLEHSNASNKICVKQSKNFGRYIAAQKEIKTGDTLVVEPPYAACLLPEYFGTHCHHCFNRLISPVGCPTCCSVAFCTAECRNIALNTYHQYECKYLDLLIGSGMSILAHTSLRMITQNTLTHILKIYDNRNSEKVLSLCTNAEHRLAEDFFQRTLMACFLLRCLQKSGYFPHQETCIPTENELKIGELLLLNLQILQFNAHEIYETKRSSENKFKPLKVGYIGVAIYPTVALFNHSCYPGVTRYFVGKNIVISAIRPIAPGDMVAENYGPIFTRRVLQERQKSLSARYWFNCQCVACLQNWPSLETGLDNVSRRIKCPTEKCCFFFTLPVSDESAKCPRCKKNVTLSNNILQLKYCEERLREVVDLIEKQNSEGAMQLLIETIETFHKISFPPHRDIHLGQELLRTILADKGNVHICSQVQGSVQN